MPRSRRDEFPRTTREHFARSLNYHCSKCGAPTVAPYSGGGGRSPLVWRPTFATAAPCLAHVIHETSALTPDTHLGVYEVAQWTTGCRHHRLLKSAARNDSAPRLSRVASSLTQSRPPASDASSEAVRTVTPWGRVTGRARRLHRRCRTARSDESCRWSGPRDRCVTR